MTKVVQFFKLFGMGPVKRFLDTESQVSLPPKQIFSGREPDKEFSTNCNNSKSVILFISTGMEPVMLLKVRSK